MNQLSGRRVLVDLSLVPDGGARTYVAGFTGGLIRGEVPSREAITVLLASSWTALHEDVVSGLQSVGVTVDVAPALDPGTWRARLARRRLLAQAIKRHEPDVVFVPRDVVPRLRVPFVMLARNRYAWQTSHSYGAIGGPFAAALLRLLARRSARRAAAVLAVSQSFASAIPEAGVSAVVHHGCSLEPYRREAQQQKSGTPLVVAMVCNVMAQKGIEVVIDGVARVSARGRPIELRVFGGRVDVAYAERLERHALDTFGISVLQGPAHGDDLVRAYREADILAVGGTFETFCFPLVEGMRSSCVVVAPRSSLVEEICGDVALTYEEGDVESFASAIDRSQRGTAARLVRGLDRAGAFTWCQTVESTLDLVRRAGGS